MFYLVIIKPVLYAVNETRFVRGGYVDIETDISDKLLLDGAGRYENYSDFGGNLCR